MKNSEDFVDFAVIKEKIIKTDRVLHMYSELKIKNQLLEKTLKETHQKYKQSIDDLTVLNLEKNRNLHQFEEVTINSEKFQIENEKLRNELKICQHDYNKNINDQQILQLKYQSICLKLEECQNSLKEYQNVCLEDSVKKGRKQRKKKAKTGKASPKKYLDSDCEDEHKYESDNGSQISNFMNECLELKPSPVKQEYNLHFKDGVSNEVNYTEILNLNTEVESLKNIIFSLKKELRQVTEEKSNLNEEWRKRVQRLEQEWSKSQQKSLLEKEQLIERLKKYEEEEQTKKISEECIINIEASNPINETKISTSQSLPMIDDVDELEISNCSVISNVEELEMGNVPMINKVKELDISTAPVVEDVGELDISNDTTMIDVEELKISNGQIDKSTAVFDTGADDIHSETECGLSDVDEIFKEMRMYSILSPLSEDQVSVVTNINNLDENLSSYDESITMHHNEGNCEKLNDNISELYQEDKYQLQRKLKARKLNSLLTIRKAKQKFWLHKSHKILNLTKDKTQNKKKIKDEVIQTPNMFCNDFVNTFVHLLNEKLNKSRSRKSKTANKSRNVLEINRMLREKARSNNPTSCYSTSLGTDDTSTNSLSCKSGEDSCYESLLSNPPSNEMITLRENISNDYPQLQNSIDSNLREDDAGVGIKICADSEFKNTVSDPCGVATCLSQERTGQEETDLSAENEEKVVEQCNSETKQLNENVCEIYSFDLDVSKCDEKESIKMNEDKMEIIEGSEKAEITESVNSETKMKIEAIKSEIMSIAANHEFSDHKEDLLTSDKLASLSSFDLEENFHKIITSETNVWSDTSLFGNEDFHEEPFSQDVSLMQRLIADSHNLNLKNVAGDINSWSNTSNIEPLSQDQDKNHVFEVPMLVNSKQEICGDPNSNDLKPNSETSHSDEKLEITSNTIASEGSVILKELKTSDFMEKPKTDVLELSIGSHPDDQILSKNENEHSSVIFSPSPKSFIDRKELNKHNCEIPNLVIDEKSIKTESNLETIDAFREMLIKANQQIVSAETRSTLNQMNSSESMDSIEIKENFEDSLVENKKIENLLNNEHHENIVEGPINTEEIDQVMNGDSADIRNNKNSHENWNDSIVDKQCDQKMVIDLVEIAEHPQELISKIPKTDLVDSIVSGKINNENSLDEKINGAVLNSSISAISIRDVNKPRISKRLCSDGDTNAVNVRKKRVRTISGESVSRINSTSDESIPNISNVDLMSGLSDSSDDHIDRVSEPLTNKNNNIAVKQKVKTTKTATLMRRSIRIYKQRNAAISSLGNIESNIQVSKDENIATQRKTRNLLKNAANNSSLKNNRKSLISVDSLQKLEVEHKSSFSLSSERETPSLQSNIFKNNSNINSVSDQHENRPIRKAKIKKWDRGKCSYNDITEKVDETINSNNDNICEISKKTNTSQLKNVIDSSVGVNKIFTGINNVNVNSQKSEETDQTSKSKKVNIIQHILLQPANVCMKPVIRTSLPQRSGGFKRPNNSKILPSTPLSPPMPKIEETQLPEKPVIIPLEKPPKLEPKVASDLFHKLITFSTEEKTVEEVARHFSSQESDHIAKLILGHVIQDNGKADKKYTQAPLMTDTQRVMLGFMLKLEQKNVKDLLNTYLELSELKLFQAKTLQEVETVTRLYVAICKSQKNIQRMRRTCCDAFYFMGDLAIPFFFIVLISWIEILPLEADSNNFPLIKVLIQLVNLKTCNIPGYNLLSLRDLLNKYYGYPREPWTTDKFFDKLIATYFQNPVKPADYPILLFCKNSTSKWVYQKIDTSLKPILPKIKGENFKATVIILISEIVSQFNGKTDGEYIAFIKDWFCSLLHEADAPDVVKRSLLLGLKKLPKSSVKKPVLESSGK